MAPKIKNIIQQYYSTLNFEIDEIYKTFFVFNNNHIFLHFYNKLS